MADNNKHLYNLDELSDYKVADGFSDVRGWEVKDRDNRVIGKVDNLLVNKEAERVVYLDVEVDKTIIDAKYDPYTNPANPDVREFVNKDGENHIIVPIGLAEIDSERKYVFTETVDHRTFAETKRYRHGSNIDRDYEVAVLDSYSRRGSVENEIDKDEVRKIVREEIEKAETTNVKEVELRNEEKVREIVRDEVDDLTDKTETTRIETSRSEVINEEIAEIERQKRERENLADKRDRLHRDDFDRTNSRTDVDQNNRSREKDRGLDFDHDNDGNPNITDPDYYKKKGRDIKNADYDHDNDGNPNITDPDYYQKKGREIKNADYDHDNGGNPNITDPDYYDGDDKRSRSRDADFDHDDDGNPNITDPDYYDDERFYERDEFDDSRFRTPRKKI